ncbi:unnamed protein product [Rhizoctonia solani]|uniref:Zn(2)-C6 fungal-type domain-containing protein n=1 Tax=Rhizoctonia solani TaxID=456999 RepID=A0A8H2WKC0_9AGAM|nr:unnamed protein product [Rhizoctonia solani]
MLDIPMSAPRCKTCEASNKKCDGTRGPTGCRRCAQAGLECGGYSSERVPKPGRGVRDKAPRSRQLVPSGIALSDIDPVLPAPGNSKPADTPNPLLILEVPSPQDASGSGEHPSADLLISSVAPAGQHHVDLDHPSSALIHQGKTFPGTAELYPTPPADNSNIPLYKEKTSPIAQAPTSLFKDSPFEFHTQIDGGAITLAQSNLFNQTTLSCGETVTSTWASSGLESCASPGVSSRDYWFGSTLGERPNAQPDLDLITNSPIYLEDENVDMENLQSLRVELLDGLVLDREIESNTVSFLIFFAVLAVSESTNYDTAPFTILYNQSLKGVVEARARGNVTRETAIEAMESCHEVISIMCKICPLASILNTMDLYAPIFRRACPEPDNEHVNLPGILTGFEVHLKLYATMDVLLSAVTSRPMFFRYNLEPPSPQAEALLNSEDGPGLRWLAGVPDRLIVTFARMNTLLEDYGNRVDPEIVQELEEEILACATTCYSGPAADPVLVLGRIVVQESWKLVAYIYLYMGLCGADSSDARVVKLRKRFISLIEGVRPRRNPDTFLVVPLMILGVATTCPTDQSIILSRLWGISECSKPGTLGNDMIRMLNSIWTSTKNRPAVWTDVREACLHIAGM